MTSLERLRRLPLRGKVLMTVLGAAVTALGGSTFLSFRYWESEALSTSEQQALLLAGSTRATLESAARLEGRETARRALTRMRADGTITTARVYTADDVVWLSADRHEEGSPAVGRWIPNARELPHEGVVHSDRDTGEVQAFVPLSLPAPAVLEVAFSVAATRAAMDRGIRLGIGLMAVSLVAVAAVVVTMFEREVVAPLHRMDVLLAGAGGQSLGRHDEFTGLESSVNRLLEREHAAEARIADQAGLAEVGELAAEMAHEFKRPLVSIRTAVDMLQQEYELDAGGRTVLDAVEGQLDRLAETMQDLFSLARPITVDRELVELGPLLDEALTEIAGTPGWEGVTVERVYPEAPLFVVGDERKLRQAFTNLLANASEAIAGEGTLRVAAQSTSDAVEVSIRDTGAGMTPDQIEESFKPFYSTKPQGTGLGLPLVARVVGAHRGGLTVESLPGLGTTVRIRLPRGHAPIPKGA